MSVTAIAGKLYHAEVTKMLKLNLEYSPSSKDLTRSPLANHKYITD